MIKLLIVGAGGFVGAVSRYLICSGAERLYGGNFPLGTFAVNLAGCLAIGAAMALVEDRPLLSEHAKLLLVTGLLASFTTFSTFGLETVELLRDGRLGLTGLYVAGSLLLGGGGVVLGRLATRAIAA